MRIAALNAMLYVPPLLLCRTPALGIAWIFAALVLFAIYAAPLKRWADQ